MAIPSWPNVQLPSAAPESIENSAIRNEMESGIVHRRAKFTRLRSTWRVHWDDLKGSDYLIIKDFYKNTLKGGALSFTWVHPIEQKTYTVSIVDTLKGDPFSFDFHKLDLTFEEV